MKGHREGNARQMVIWKEIQFAKQMAVCAWCGREFDSKPEDSACGQSSTIVRFFMRILSLALVVLFLIVGFALIGTDVGEALAEGDFSLPTLSLLAIFIVILVLMVLVFRNWRQSRVQHRYCPSCAKRY